MARIFTRSGAVSALAVPFLLAPLLLATPQAVAQIAVPPAVASDPAPDAAHPARMEVLHIPSGDVAINGVAYLAAGEGPHPTVIVCHGLPGNEKNLDLAQALRRAGWNAITFNYRGSWGSPGTYRFGQNPQDLHAVLTWLRAPAQVKALGIDISRMAVVGHSMGGWVTAMAGPGEPGVRALALVSAANMGQIGKGDRASRVSLMAENYETLAGTTPETLADEIATASDRYDFLHQAQALVHVPMLVLSADDGLAPQTDALVAAIRKAGGQEVTAVHVATDHSWSGKRIELESRIINFLQPILERREK